jgi:hypothetical protein
LREEDTAGLILVIETKNSRQGSVGQNV